MEYMIRYFDLASYINVVVYFQTHVRFKTYVKLHVSIWGRVWPQNSVFVVRVI